MCLTSNVTETPIHLDKAALLTAKETGPAGKSLEIRAGF